MLTLITGNPGSFKTAMTVWDICRQVPGSTVEGLDGRPVERHLYTNIPELLVEHSLIEGADMMRWHEWCKPGDVLVFDEVQHVWRPRSMGVKVPSCIEALETHRHLGVDLVLISQHPMLLDQNVRRLVNRHIHMRRMSVGLVYRYEWDHCSEGLRYRNALNSGMWRRPRAVFGMYKSAQLHTKSTARIPSIAYVGLAALAGLVYFGPLAYGRLTNTLTGQSGAAVSARATASAAGASKAASSAPAGANVVPVVPGGPPVQALVDRDELTGRGYEFGCVRTVKRCGCFQVDGREVLVDPSVCFARLPDGAPAVDLEKTVFRSEAPKPQPMDPNDLQLLSDVKRQRRG